MTEIIATSILINLIFSLSGCFVLWKRYVYYGDGLSHASMLAAVVSVILGIPILYIGIVNTAFFIGFVFKVKSKSGNSAAIGFTSSIMVSLASVLSYIFPMQFNIDSLLFGDIVAANGDEVFILCLILILTVGFISLNYNKLILIILSRDIAYSRGINVRLIEFLFLSILSFSIIATVKIVGALLVTSLLLIPATAARLISNSPINMIIISIVTGQIMNLFGISLSYLFDLPFAPVTILCGGAIFVIIKLLKHTKIKNTVL